MSTARRLDPDLESALKKLRLGKMIPTLPERIALAKKSKMSFGELLLLVLRDEVDRRDSTATVRRAKEAGLLSVIEKRGKFERADLGRLFRRERLARSASRRR